MSDALPSCDVNAMDAWLKLNRINARNALHCSTKHALAAVFLCGQTDFALA